MVGGGGIKKTVGRILQQSLAPSAYSECGLCPSRIVDIPWDLRNADSQVPAQTCAAHPQLYKLSSLRRTDLDKK